MSLTFLTLSLLIRTDLRWCREQNEIARLHWKLEQLRTSSAEDASFADAWGRGSASKTQQEAAGRVNWGSGEREITLKLRHPEELLRMQGMTDGEKRKENTDGEGRREDGEQQLFSGGE